MSDDDSKTERLDDDYFRSIAQRAKGQLSDSDKTQILGAAPQPEVRKSESGGDKTQVFGGFPGGGGEKHEAKVSTQSSAPMEDPPVGWLVAIDGPGKGSVLTLGVGLNSIGRGDEARVSIPFSDNEISRGKAVVIAYDKKNNQYFLLPGDGKTIAYVEDSPILQNQVLSSGDSFSLGASVFRFVALCDENFSWG